MPINMWSTLLHRLEGVAFQAVVNKIFWQGAVYAIQSTPDESFTRYEKSWHLDELEEESSTKVGTSSTHQKNPFNP